MTFYKLDDQDWEYFTEQGFIAVPVWGGFIFTKPGYKHIHVDHEKPELTHITDQELTRLVQKLQSYE